MPELTEVLSAIGEPIRFEVLRLLAAEEGAAQAALAERLGLTPSRLGNHLAALRASGLVTTVRDGRSTRYYLTRADAVRALISAVENVAAGPAERSPAPAGPIAVAARPGATPEPALSAFARARTCYDHLAGEVGVRLLDRLVAEGALIPGPEPESVLETGEGLDSALAGLRVELPRAGRRKLAVGCLDATAGRPHLGGALGSEILRSFLRRGLLLPGPSPRSLIEHPDLQKLLA